MQMQAKLAYNQYVASFASSICIIFLHTSTALVQKQEAPLRQHNSQTAAQPWAVGETAGCNAVGAASGGSA